MNFFKLSRGFTLAEILVVVSIISVLAGLIAVNTTRAQQSSRDSRRQADLQTIAGGLELYYTTNRQYPVQTSPTSVNSGVLTQELVPAYNRSIPTDPHPNIGNWFEYSYVTDSAGSMFALEAQLERASDRDTTTTKPNVGTNDPGYYITGVFKDGEVYKYRVSGR